MSLTGLPSLAPRRRSGGRPRPSAAQPRVRSPTSATRAARSGAPRCRCRFRSRYRCRSRSCPDSGPGSGPGLPSDDRGQDATRRLGAPGPCLDAERVGPDPLGPPPEPRGQLRQVSIRAAPDEGLHLGDGEPQGPQHDGAGGIHVHGPGARQREVLREAGRLGAAVEDRARDALDLEQLVHAVEVRVLRAIREGQAHVVVALRPVQPVLLVRVPPVLDRVDDHVARRLLDAELQEEPVQNVARRAIQVDPSGLVREPVREASRAEGDVEALGDPGGPKPRPAEDEGAARVQLVGQSLREDLGHRALVRGLGEPGLAERETEVRRGDGLETHGLGEFPDDHEEQREQQEHHDQGDPRVALARARLAAGRRH